MVTPLCRKSILLACLPPLRGCLEEVVPKRTVSFCYKVILIDHIYPRFLSWWDPILGCPHQQAMMAHYIDEYENYITHTLLPLASPHLNHHQITNILWKNSVHTSRKRLIEAVLVAFGDICHPTQCFSFQENLNKSWLWPRGEGR